jgi:hypothetical protein
MTIELEASVVVPRKVDDVFAAAAGDADRLARYFTGYPPLIPGIAAAAIDGGGAPREGALRTVKLTDGTTIRERITRFDAPRAHGYEMAEMNALQRLFCANMISLWTFADEGGATRVVWRYSIVEKGALTWPLAWAVSRLFQRAMQRCLDNLSREER